MKKYISLLLCVILLTSLFGCEDISEEASSPEPSESSEVSSEESTVPNYDRPLLEIREGYTIDEAKKDGLIVFKSMEILAGETLWRDFVAKTAMGESARVRIYHGYDSSYFVSDLIYDGEKYTRTLYDKKGDTNEWFLSESSCKYLVQDYYKVGDNGFYTDYFFLTDRYTATAKGWERQLVSSTILPEDESYYCFPIYSNKIPTDKDTDDERRLISAIHFDIDGDGDKEKLEVHNSTVIRDGNTESGADIYIDGEIKAVFPAEYMHINGSGGRADRLNFVYTENNSLALKHVSGEQTAYYAISYEKGELLIQTGKIASE